MSGRSPEAQAEIEAKYAAIDLDRYTNRQGTEVRPPPICCGAPMRKAGYPGWICNGGVDPLDGKGCERHEAPDGVRTDGPWWKEPPGFARRVRERCQ